MSETSINLNTNPYVQFGTKKTAPDVKPAVDNNSNKQYFPYLQKDEIGVNKFLFQTAQADKTLSFFDNSVSEEPAYVDGNSVEMFPTDKKALEGLLRDISSATKKIQFESFLFGGEDGNKIADAMIAKHKAGVKVEVVLDKKGQQLDKETIVKKLRSAGIEVRYYDTAQLKMSAIAVDHTKLSIIDGKTGWEGGVNFDVENNRDLMSRVQGPAVRNIQKIFVDAWNLAGSKENCATESLDPAPAPQGNVSICVTETSPSKETSHELALEKLKDLKKGDGLALWMMDLGDHDVVKEIVKAKKRGADIKILLDNQVPFQNGPVADLLGPLKKPAANMASGIPDLYAVAELQKAGIPVKYYKAPAGIDKLHAKVAIFTYNDPVKQKDGTIKNVPRKELMTGSTNWIKGAFEFNHEMAAFMKGGDVGEQVQKFFEEDWKKNSSDAPEIKGILKKIKVNAVGVLTNTLVSAPFDDNIG